MKQLVGTGQSEVGSTGEKIRSATSTRSRSPSTTSTDTLENIAAVTDKVNKGEGTVGRLLNDDTIANNVEQITDRRRQLHPLAHAPADARRPALRVQRRRQHAQDLRLHRAAGRGPIKLLPHRARRRSARPPHRHTRTFTTTDDPSKPQTVNTETVTISDQFRFTLPARQALLPAQRARGADRPLRHQGVDGRHRRRRRHPAGAGVATGLRTLSLKVDLFDFRTNIYPRLKVLAALRVLQAPLDRRRRRRRRSTAAARAPAASPAATTSSACSSPSTTTTCAPCSRSAARRS